MVYPDFLVYGVRNQVLETDQHKNALFIIYDDSQEHHSVKEMINVQLPAKSAIRSESRSPRLSCRSNSTLKQAYFTHES